MSDRSSVDRILMFVLPKPQVVSESSTMNHSAAVVARFAVPRTDQSRVSWFSAWLRFIDAAATLVAAAVADCRARRLRSTTLYSVQLKPRGRPAAQTDDQCSLQAVQVFRNEMQMRLTRPSYLAASTVVVVREEKTVSKQ